MSIIKIANDSTFGYDQPILLDARAINFQSVLETGNIPTSSGIGAMRSGWGPQHIDWDSDDAFTQALDQIKENTASRIQQSAELQELLEKDQWTREDRVAWEREVSTIVSEEHNNISGLDNYRNVSNSSQYPDVERRVTNLNDLSYDIENNTQTLEHDCETNSIVEGVVLQQIDVEFLPDASEVGDYKEASNYFFVRGGVSFDQSDTSTLYHAYVVSSGTGNVIEATNDPDKNSSSQYLESSRDDYSFEAFIRGDVATFNNSEYAYGGDLKAEDLIQARIDQGVEEFSKGHVYDNLYPEAINHRIDTQGPASVPPEVESLSIIKEQIDKLERGPQDSMTIHQIDTAQQRFDDQYQELVETGGIIEVSEYIGDNAQLDQNYQNQLDQASQEAAQNNQWDAEESYETTNMANQNNTFMVP
jgi:hypothetical protein